MKRLVKLLNGLQAIDIIMTLYVWIAIVGGIEKDTLNGVQAILIFVISSVVSYLLLRVLAEASERIMNR